ncbi:hypothetical protein GUJ93_ZPchr0010g8673 [Zizania palustris]|uniref:Bromo domain-containing protein n=1 Tax=Zizania palustris TaxID=103762 RepID=A0A8J5WE13_ZIZPA|nr:hypothetical protein GUJ93_ZPchr0010g8673 [Zizania palustris]
MQGKAHRGLRETKSVTAEDSKEKEGARRGRGRMVNRGGKRVKDELLELPARGKVPGGHELTKVAVFFELNQLETGPHQGQPGERRRAKRGGGKGRRTHPERRYIKDYDGGILMECKIDQKLPYVDLATMIRRQRQAIDEKIRELSNCHIVYSGIDFQKKDAGIPRRTMKPEDIPGLREAGWTPDQWGHSKSRSAFSPDYITYRQQLTNLMRLLLKNMNEHPDAWPFKEPVDSRDVPDYYDIIKDPIDLKTMSRRVDSEQYYVTLEMFVADMKRMVSNAKTYNSPDTIYYKCASRLESFFTNKVASQLAQASTKN